MEGSWDCSPPRIVVLFIVQQPLQHPELRHQTERVTFFLSWLSTSLLLSSLRQFFVSVIFPFSLNVRPNIPVRLFYCSLGLASCFFFSLLPLFVWLVGRLLCLLILPYVGSRVRKCAPANVCVAMCFVIGQKRTRRFLACGHTHTNLLTYTHAATYLDVHRVHKFSNSFCKVPS